MESLVKGFKENKAFRFTSLLVVLLLAITFLAPVIAPYDPLSAVMKDANQAPSAAHLFGTDKLGRDVLSRILYGASYSLTSVIALVACIFVVGTTMGIISGYFGGIVDIVIMRIADMMISFPGVILAIAIAGIMGGSLINAMIALTAVTWTKYARLSRSMVLKIKRREFVDAAVVSGGSAAHILWVHILPNILPLMVITAAADIGAMMMELAGLSFLGFGSQPPAPEWGLMLNEGLSHRAGINQRLIALLFCDGDGRIGWPVVSRIIEPLATYILREKSRPCNGTLHPIAIGGCRGLIYLFKFGCDPDLVGRKRRFNDRSRRRVPERRAMRLDV